MQEIAQTNFLSGEDRRVNIQDIELIGDVLAHVELGNKGSAEQRHVRT